MKKVLSLVLGAIFLISGSGAAVAQNVIDFEDMIIDVLANKIYQENTPFFPGVLIRTIDAEGIITGWPIVVRANPQLSEPECLTVPTPHGNFIAFRSNLCGTNSVLNYPVHSDYNSLSKGSIDARVKDGFVITFNYPISEFSVWFADWGDWFPTEIPEESEDGYIKLIAYDGENKEIASTGSIELSAQDPSRDASKGEPNGIFNLYFSTPNMRKVEVRFIGKNDPGVTIDDIEFTGDLNVDIKPGSYPNCINSNGHGVIPVAILGSEEFNVTIIDPSTVKLDEQPVRMKGKSGRAGSYEDVNDDGFIDLVVQIEDKDVYFPEDTIGTVTAKSFEEVHFEGQDSICIKP
jgi:hypothetical protein